MITALFQLCRYSLGRNTTSFPTNCCVRGVLIIVLPQKSTSACLPNVSSWIKYCPSCPVVSIGDGPSGLNSFALRV